MKKVCFIIWPYCLFACESNDDGDSINNESNFLIKKYTYNPPIGRELSYNYNTAGRTIDILAPNRSLPTANYQYNANGFPQEIIWEGVMGLKEIRSSADGAITENFIKSVNSWNTNSVPNPYKYLSYNFDRTYDFLPRHYISTKNPLSFNFIRRNIFNHSYLWSYEYDSNGKTTHIFDETSGNSDLFLKLEYIKVD